MPCVQRKADWALQWINDNKSTFGKDDTMYKTWHLELKIKNNLNLVKLPF